jgi:60 kDa SS-A/Ro ribonucleoprotein
MANKQIFQSTRTVNPPVTDTTNLAGGVAYSMGDKAALAQLIVTGTFSGTFYANANSQLDTITALLNKLGPENAEFIAKLAVYAREKGFMKDTPAFLTAWLTVNGKSFVKQVFNRVIDNGKMLRNFVQIMRSGAVGRKSLGTGPKKLVQNWLNDASVYKLLSASVGNNPSLADVIKMVHPTPANQQKEAFFRWILGQKVEAFALLPLAIQELIAFRNGDSLKVPEVPFELLTNLELKTEDWKEIARNAGWQMTRMNLNTFNRKGVLADKEMVYLIARRLADPEAIANARVMPYQIFTTWLNMGSDIDPSIRRALEKALDYSLNQVPKYSGKTWVFVDVSGSMANPVTGYRDGSTSKMRCVDVAALIASSLLRVNPEGTRVVMFDTRVHTASLNPRSSVMENAKIIAKFGGGGTACQLPLQKLVDTKAKGDLIIYVSDNESWFNTRKRYYSQNQGTETAAAWEVFKKRNPGAKLVCIDLTPNITTQSTNGPDILNVGGFNDSVYGVIESFLEQDADSNFWTNKIEESVHLKV